MRNLKRSVFTRICPFFLLLLVASGLQAQDTLRVMCYNLLRYGAPGIGCTPTGVTTRNPWISGILDLVRPDIFGVNEVGPYSGPTSPSNNLLVNILQPINPAYRATTITFNTFQDVANMMYYNSDKLGLAQEAVIPEPTLDLRDINYYKFYYKGPGLASGDTTFVEVVQVHLHSSDEPTREVQTFDIMHFLDSLGRPGNYIVQGDFNLDGSTPQSFQNMVAHTNPDVKMNDVLNLTGNWHSNASVRYAMTQATDPTPSNPCGSGGQLDDRFDHILVSNSIENNTDDVRYIPGSYWVPGNPNAPNTPVGATIQGYIRNMSDHHPVVMDLEVSRAVANESPKPRQKMLQVLTNPALDQIRIRLALGELQGTACSLDLLNLNGQKVKTWTVDATSGTQYLNLDAATLPAGAYFLRLMVDESPMDMEKVILGLH
jgi:endonuclease/exonuclease/phosphatase family metal-dependent hydrolase